jgi:periplasmic divalent cation tolerance protein
MVRTLVEEHLAAGGNIVPGIQSTYRWDGAVREAAEVLLILKTRTDRANRLSARIVASHPYKCPCFVMLPIMGATRTTWQGSLPNRAMVLMSGML